MAVSLRQRLRATFLRTLRRAFDTDEGRRILVDGLDDLLVRRPDTPFSGADAPYEDLGRASQAQRRYDGTVFITARFRTGSTLLWNIFRHIDGCVSYYEPLNERRWFDPGARGDRIDASHRGVSDYWREYEGLADLSDVYLDSWTNRRLLLDSDAWEPRLMQYFDRLIDHAAPRRAVLQCNRIDFRLPWIRRQFPGATILHLYRHPRDQWCSALLRPEAVPRDVTLAEFGRYDRFYLSSWATDLERHFPFLASQRQESAYRTFYLIWKLSFLAGVTHADQSISFEALTDRPGEALPRLLAMTSMTAELASLQRLVGRPRDKGDRDRYAPPSWFSEHEAAAEKILADYAAPLSSLP